MFNSKINENFIVEIRGVDPCLQDARISSIEIDKKERSIDFLIICPLPVSEEIQNKLLKKITDLTPNVFTSVKVRIRKIATDIELITKEITKFLESNFRSISVFLKATDVIVKLEGDKVFFLLRLTPDGVEYVNKNNVLNKIADHLSATFCADFVGRAEEKEGEELPDLLDEKVFIEQLEKVEHRTIKVKSVLLIDDITIGDTAVYIEDALSGSFVVCGKITEIVEKETKNGKPFFIVRIDDTTGTIGGVYFSKKNTVDKIRELKVGDGIIARGTIGDYNGRKSFTFEKINGCEFPDNFVKKEKYKKQPPKDYKLIFPTKAEVVKVSSVFDDDNFLPKELLENEYVVFDLETTGTDVMSNGITEIGAVKIRDGKMVEQFTSLIKPDYAITEEITRLTGINEEMVKNSPKIGAVIPDFIKFIQGATLVAHNADFDVKFIKRFAGAEDYAITNKVVDTLELSRRYLTMLKKADLKTVAEHFNIEFRHHRALSDAYATAEIFIELLKIKSKS